MRQFGSYPIFVNHPGHWQDVRARQREIFLEKRDYKMVTWLDYTAKRLYEIMLENPQRPESVIYEQQIYKLLTRIASTRMGKLLFDSLNTTTKFWIVPKDLADDKDCTCTAYTFPGQPKEGGGVRVYFNPTDIGKGLSADDVLFHEMVHAYRNGEVGYAAMNKGRNARMVNEWTSAEEFLALHFQNMYLADLGSPRFYLSYLPTKYGSKDTAYQFYSNDAVGLMAFRYWVTAEPLAKTISGWMHPPNSFNPWRDFQILERIYLKDSEMGISQLPPF